MVDSEYNTDDYKSSKNGIQAVMKNPEMLKTVPDHLETKKMYNYAVKKITFCIRYVPDKYKTKKCVIKLFQKMVDP